MYQNYWNASTGQPNTDASGNPIEFTMASAYHAGPCVSMQWTSFQTDANDVPTVRNLLANGNPTQMNIGDNTWIEPGTKTTLFSSVPYPADVLLPVVVDLTTHAAVPIVAFAPFHIDSSTGGSCKCIQGHFITNYKANTGSAGAGNGPYYGAYTPAMLAQ